MFEQLKIKIKNFSKEPQDKLIMCKECNEVQKLAIDWDFQICDKCNCYLYDYR